MDKKIILVFVAGYLLSVLLPPQRLMGFFKGGTA